MQTLKKFYFGKSKFPKISDPDAQAFIVVTNIKSKTIANALNDLCIGLKLADIWSKFYAIYPFVGGTAFTHKFNLKDPRDLNAAFRISFNGNQIHNSNGVSIFTGSQINTNINFLSNTILNNFHWSVNVVAGTSNNLVFYALPQSNGQMYTLINIGGNKMLNDLYNTAGANGRVVGANNIATGNFLASRIPTTTHSIYRSGVKIASNNLTAGSLGNNNIFIGNASSNVGTFSFSTIGLGLTDTEVTTLDSCIQNFQTSLSRT